MRQWWLADRPPEPKLQEHLARIGQLFLIVTQGREKLHPFVKVADKMIVRADKKSYMSQLVFLIVWIKNLFIASSTIWEEKFRRAGPSEKKYFEQISVRCSKTILPFLFTPDWRRRPIRLLWLNGQLKIDRSRLKVNFGKLVWAQQSKLSSG